MDYLDYWKSLILETDKTIRKRKPEANIATPVLLLACATLLSGVLLAFGESGALFAGLLGIGQTWLFLLFIAIEMPMCLLQYYMMHWLAVRLGGRGKFVDFITVAYAVALPFSVINLVAFVPCIGKIISVISGLAALIACLFVVFKYIRIKYGLSFGRALAAMFVPMLLVGIVLTAAICAFGFVKMMEILQTGGTAPAITATAGGYHLYSPLHGGYSFDYPKEWAPLLQKLKENSSGNASSAGLANMVSTAVQNEYVSMAMLENEKTNQTVTVAFTLKGGDDMDLNACTTENVRAETDGDFDTGRAVAFKHVNGRFGGCMVTGMVDREDGQVMDTYVSGACSETHMLTVVGSERAYPVMLSIISSMRCGSDAVK